MVLVTCQFRRPDSAAEHVNRGNAWHDKGHFDGALADYEKAIALNPNDAYFYNNRGSARRIKGDLSGALADLNKSIAFDPKNAEANCDLGLLYLTQGKDIEANVNLTRCYDLDSKLKASFEKMVDELKKK